MAGGGGKSDIGRFAELDALRGLAACVVVFCHFDLLWVWDTRPAWLRGLLQSPLRILVAGPESVILFFVLSGFVLALPFLGRGSPGYGPYLVKRVFRIYVPYVAVLFLAVGGAVVFQGHGHLHGLESWTDHAWSGPIDWSLVIQHLGFLGEYDYWRFNPAFWSLIHEMRISLVFPGLCLLVLRIGTKASMALAAGLTICAAVLIRLFGHEDLFLSLHYGGMFVAGILLARNMGAVAEWYQRLAGLPRAALMTASLIWFAYGRQMRVLDVMGIRLGEWVVAAGALGIMAMALNSPSFRNLLRTRGLRVLGRISYSTYLIHLIVLLALVYGTKATLPPVALLLLYVVLTFAAALLFHLSVEEPARRSGGWLAARLRSQRG